jgi:DNA-binding CsgD family transcriptional regulator
MERTLRAMLSPLAYPDAASWGRALCEAAQGLVDGRAEASLYVAGGDTPSLLHTTMDPALPAGYFAYWWTQDAPMLEIIRRRLTVGHPLMVASERELYASPLFHECIQPTGLDYSVGLSAFDPSGLSPRLLLTHRRSERPDDLARLVTVLSTLAPAFTAGTATWLAARAAAAGRAEPALLCDTRGRVLHETPALAAMLAPVPGAAAAQVRAAAQALAAAAGLALRQRVGGEPGGAGRAGSPGEAQAAVDAAARVVVTPAGTFRLRGVRAPEDAPGGAPAVLVVVDELAPPAGSVAAPGAGTHAGAAARYRLTPQEVLVARLMAERRTDHEIAQALGISPNTARTHAERVRRKLGVARRTEVAAALAGG